MVRSHCCSKQLGINRGAWTADEDKILRDYVTTHGEGKWRNLPMSAGLKRCGKSCRLRWLNYLRPDIKRGNISHDEEDLIIRLHKLLGNRWSLIAGRLPGRTDNEIKNYWNANLSKRVHLHHGRRYHCPHHHHHHQVASNNSNININSSTSTSTFGNTKRDRRYIYNGDDKADQARVVSSLVPDHDDHNGDINSNHQPSSSSSFMVNDNYDYNDRNHLDINFEDLFEMVIDGEDVAMYGNVVEGKKNNKGDRDNDAPLMMFQYGTNELLEENWTELEGQQDQVVHSPSHDLQSLINFPDSEVDWLEN